jgi:hypothetical protein
LRRRVCRITRTERELVFQLRLNTDGGESIGDHQPLHWSGTEVELQSLGRETASVRLMGRLKGTLPVRMRQAQSAPVRTISASTPQHCFVGEPPPLVLPVTKLRHGVNVDISDAVHDVATCPDAGAAATTSSSSSTATAAAAGNGSNLSRRLVIRQDTPAPLEPGFRKGTRGFFGVELFSRQPSEVQRRHCAGVLVDEVCLYRDSVSGVRWGLGRVGCAEPSCNVDAWQLIADCTMILLW